MYKYDMSMVSMSSVAKEAGVATITVSRVFRDDPNVSPGTRERVQVAARRMGYRVNPAARRLKNNLKDIVGVMVATEPSEDGSIADAYCMDPGVLRRFSSFIGLLASRLESVGRHIMLGQLGGNGDTELPLLVQTAYASPLIILSEMWQDLADDIRRYNIPSVVVDGPSFGLPAVQRDEIAAVELLVDHLVSLGHRRIAFINHGHRKQFGYRDSLWPSGYFQAVTRHQLVPVEGWDHFDAVDVRIDALLALDVPPTALIAYDEIQALAVMRILAERGLSVPGNISVSAMLDHGVSREAMQPITHVTFPSEPVVKYLHDQIVNNAIRVDRGSEKRFAGELFKGETTGQCRAAKA